MSKLIKLLIFIILIGCGNSLGKNFHYIGDEKYNLASKREYNIWIDDKFGEMDRAAIDNGIMQWNYALNGNIKLVVKSYEFDMEISKLEEIVKEGGWLIFKIDSNNGMIVDRKSGVEQFHTLAWVDKIGGTKIWVVRERVKNEWMTGLMMHEIGHLLGAKHDKGLMRPHYRLEDYRCIDYEAISMVAEYQGIEIERLNYCID